ncbi:MAG TPA: hypothetical protein VGD54_02975 [Steroidobacteraceae bacterium]
MTPSPTQRDELFKRFARALFKGDMDALYAVVAPGFRWSFHDGLAVTKSSSVLRPFANTSPHKRSCSRRSDFTTRPIVTLHDVPHQRDRARNRRAARAARCREL